MSRPIVHIEIVSKDPAKSNAFAGKLFGWETSHMAEYDYHGWKSENVAGAFPGINEMMKEGSVILYVNSENIEADLEAIKAEGGSPLGEIVPIPGMGRFAHFADPTGAIMALWQSDPMPE